MDYERRIEKLELKLAPKKRFAAVILYKEGQDLTEAKRATGNDPDDPGVMWFVIHLHGDGGGPSPKEKDTELIEELQARAEYKRLEELKRHGLAE